MRGNVSTVRSEGRERDPGTDGHSGAHVTGVQAKQDGGWRGESGWRGTRAR